MVGSVIKESGKDQSTVSINRNEGNEVIGISLRGIGGSSVKEIKEVSSVHDANDL